LGMLLVCDLPQKFFFHPFPILDRSRALDYAMEHSWDRTLKANAGALTNTFKNLAFGFESDAVPGLFLNTTDVESGQRVVITPFLPPASKAFLTLYDVDPSLDMPVSTAAFLSARFPVLSPAAWLDSGSNRDVHVVDGGVFENSGCATLLDIYRALRAMPDAQSTNIICLRIDTVDELPSLKSVDASFRTDLIIPPLSAFWMAREARARVAVLALEQQQGITNIDSKKRKVRLDVGTNINLAPLGWTLSSFSRSNINAAYKLSYPVTNLPGANFMTNAIVKTIFESLRNTNVNTNQVPLKPIVQSP
jgi:hypothetical protein